jgi:hypothetical protein
MIDATSPTPTISQLFDQQSAELAEYKKLHPVGSRVGSWVVKALTEDSSIPPDPTTGKAVTKVTLTLEAPK